VRVDAVIKGLELLSKFGAGFQKHSTKKSHLPAKKAHTHTWTYLAGVCMCYVCDCELVCVFDKGVKRH